MSLKTSTSLDVLNIDSKLLKIAAHLISPSLTHVFNLSLHAGILPDDFKFARVTPVFKNKGDPFDPSNYRPISVISHVSKILEKSVKTQLMSYLLRNNLLTSNQYAYIKGKSTQLALHTVIEKWLKNIDNGEITAACFLDLSKCFDTVKHSVLLRKLINFGINGTEYKWFESYLSQRTQIVRCNNILSKPNTLPIGVPQGTILGPIFFILFINDLALHLPNNSFIMYADDITLFTSNKCLFEAESQLQLYVNITASWLTDNGLVVNPSKSNSMIIGTKQRTNKPNSLLQIKINNSIIDQTNSFKLLGVEIDNNLTWNNHASQIAKRLSSKIGLIKRLQQTLPSHIIHKLYAPLFLSQIDYCFTVWGKCSSQAFNRIQRLQNRAARVFAKNFNRNISSQNILKELGWLSVSNRLKYLTGSFIYKCLNDVNVYNKMKNTYTFLANLNYARSKHTHKTRFAINKCLSLPKPRTAYLKNSLSYSGVLLWNSIPPHIRNCTTIDSFKRMYRLFLSE